MRVGGLWVLALAGLAACGDPRTLESDRGGGTANECSTCHTGPGESPPFRDVRGTPGAHDAHLAGVTAKPIACAQCHTVPQHPDDPGHFEDAPTDISFGPLARTGGASPTWNGAGCQASYCHGNFPGGNASNAPVWSTPRTQTCGTCHGVPPKTGQHFVHADQAIGCQTCHGILTPADHVNGIKDVPLQAWSAGTRSCGQACHEPRSWGP